MIRDGGSDAWTNVTDTYNCHVAWRLADDPDPGDIEGWPGHIQADAFHLMCEGTSNVERNYAPDVYAPGTGAAIHCRDLAGSRYSTMAYMAADTSSWFEACIRGLMPQGGAYAEAGPSYWILDDLRLVEHGQEDLIVTTPTPPACIPLWEFLYR
jgi:hypothetical protein